MDYEEIMRKVEKIPMEEKLKLLSATDKAYIQGYVDRAYIELQKSRNQKTKQQQKEKSENET
jgi:hypothetical protein